MFTQSTVHTAGGYAFDTFIRSQTLPYTGPQCGQHVSNINTSRGAGRHCLVKKYCNAMTCSSYETDRSGSDVNTNRVAEISHLWCASQCDSTLPHLYASPDQATGRVCVCSRFKLRVSGGCAATLLANSRMYGLCGNAMINRG